MEQLNYKVLKASGYKGYILEDAPVKVMQFGEGNFLRAFVDYWFDMANERAGWNGKVTLVQPIAQGLTDFVNKQEGLYTLYLRGSQNGQKVNDKRVISSVKNCINPYTKEASRHCLSSRDPRISSTSYRTQPRLASSMIRIQSLIRSRRFPSRAR